MGNIIKMALSALVAFGMCACAGLGWVHPSKTESDFNQDRFNCEREAANSYPVQLSGGSRVYNTNCQNSGGGYAQCQTTSTSGPQYDVNANSRAIAFSSCMRANGWTWRWGQP